MKDDITPEEQRACVDKNSQHVIKSLVFAIAKLKEYYHGAAAYNGMSYRHFCSMHDALEKQLNEFRSVNDRVNTNLEAKEQVSPAVRNIPRRSSRSI